MTLVLEVEFTPYSITKDIYIDSTRKRERDKILCARPSFFPFLVNSDFFFFSFFPISFFATMIISIILYDIFPSLCPEYPLLVSIDRFIDPPFYT